MISSNEEVDLASSSSSNGNSPKKHIKKSISYSIMNILGKNGNNETNLNKEKGLLQTGNKENNNEKNTSNDVSSETASPSLSSQSVNSSVNESSQHQQMQNPFLMHQFLAAAAAANTNKGSQNNIPQMNNTKFIK